ncbi:MAG: hypothetical protein IPJ20_07035 [Flammeovirgaceae bacterium]|nr:hypothetical protein [Flammeovirgaceae bacterium]
MTKCNTGKRLYTSEALAEDALIGAHINFDYRTGSGPVAIYKCDECGNYHLTSHGEMNKRLALQLQSGFIQKQKQAARWQDKLK